MAGALSRCLQSPEPDIRVAAVDAIGRLISSPDTLTAIASTSTPELV